LAALTTKSLTKTLTDNEARNVASWTDKLALNAARQDSIIAASYGVNEALTAVNDIVKEANAFVGN
jgi:hypothetical protein